MAKRKEEGTTKKPKRPKVALVDSSELGQLSLAMRAVLEAQKPTTSLIQMRLKVGYAAAAGLLDRLEELAVVTPVVGSMPRKLTGYVPVLKAKVVAAPPIEQPAKKKKPGPVSMYTPALAARICTRIATGESVLQICRDEDMPEARTVYLWLLDEDKEDFRKMYDRAREIQAEYMHDQLTEIADDSVNDWVEKENQSGDTYTVFDHEHVQRARLRVDTRKWILARMNPKKYGEKVDMTSGGKPLKEPRAAVINYVVPAAPKAV